jgi:hypothetical protein
VAAPAPEAAAKPEGEAKPAEPTEDQEPAPAADQEYQKRMDRASTSADLAKQASDKANKMEPGHADFDEQHRLAAIAHHEAKGDFDAVREHMDRKGTATNESREHFYNMANLHSGTGARHEIERGKESDRKAAAALTGKAALDKNYELRDKIKSLESKMAAMEDRHEAGKLHDERINMEQQLKAVQPETLKELERQDAERKAAKPAGGVRVVEAGKVEALDRPDKLNAIGPDGKPYEVWPPSPREQAHAKTAGAVPKAPQPAPGPEAKPSPTPRRSPADVYAQSDDATSEAHDLTREIREGRSKEHDRAADLHESAGRMHGEAVTLDPDNADEHREYAARHTKLAQGHRREHEKGQKATQGAQEVYNKAYAASEAAHDASNALGENATPEEHANAERLHTAAAKEHRSAAKTDPENAQEHEEYAGRHEKTAAGHREKGKAETPKEPATEAKPNAQKVTELYDKWLKNADGYQNGDVSGETHDRVHGEVMREAKAAGVYDDLMAHAKQESDKRHPPVKLEHRPDGTVWASREKPTGGARVVSPEKPAPKLKADEGFSLGGQTADEAATPEEPQDEATKHQDAMEKVDNAFRLVHRGGQGNGVHGWQKGTAHALAAVKAHREGNHMDAVKHAARAASASPAWGKFADEVHNAATVGMDLGPKGEAKAPAPKKAEALDLGGEYVTDRQRQGGLGLSPGPAKPKGGVRVVGA